MIFILAAEEAVLDFSVFKKAFHVEKIQNNFSPLVARPKTEVMLVHVGSGYVPEQGFGRKRTLSAKRDSSGLCIPSPLCPSFDPTPPD